jgi:hypothetical protein
MKTAMTVTTTHTEEHTHKPVQDDVVEVVALVRPPGALEHGDVRDGGVARQDVVR